MVCCSIDGVRCLSGLWRRLYPGLLALLVLSRCRSRDVQVDVDRTSLTSGTAGIGVRGAPSGNNILQAQMGGLDTAAPTAIPSSTVTTSVYPNQVDFHGKGTTENSGGTGIVRYYVARSSGPTQCSRTVADLTDATVAASSTYTLVISCAATAVECRSKSHDAYQVSHFGGDASRGSRM